MNKQITLLALCLLIAIVFAGFFISQKNNLMSIDELPKTNPPIKKINTIDPNAYTIGDDALHRIEKKHGDLLYESTTTHHFNFSEFNASRENSLVTFKVNKDSIEKTSASKKEQFQDIVKDTALQLQLWQRFSEIIPADNRKMVTTFKIITDGPDNTLGYVQQMEKATDWTLALDYQDAENLNGLYATIVHEYGHLFSLNASEFNNAKSCKTYKIDFYCLNDDAYLYQFYKEFWQPKLIDEWRSIDDISNDYDLQTSFFSKHSNEFVSEYATSHPSEDFAESWMYFVLSEKPLRFNVADDKKLFFYQFPELVQLRNDILLNMEKNYK